MKRLYPVICALIMLAACSTAVPPEVPKSEGPFEMLSLHTRYKMKISNDCSAGAALVLKDGAMIYERYFGATHRGPGAAPIDSASRFPFYSISKEFGVAVLLSLVSDSLLALDDPVCKYLDYFTGGKPFQREKVTLRQLASHTAGVTRPRDAAASDPEFADVTLEFEPGTDFNYNELGMKILGRVMEKAGGKPYEELLKERILQPLGLTSVGYLRRGDDTTGVVHTCAGLDSSFIHYSPDPYPGSGLFGNMRDIARFGQLWLDRGMVDGRPLFRADLVDDAWTNYNHFGHPHCDTEYGLMTWLSSPDKAAFMAGAAQTVGAILPDQKMIVLIGLNQFDGDPGWGRPPVEHSNVARLGMALEKALSSAAK